MVLKKKGDHLTKKTVKEEVLDGNVFDTFSIDPQLIHVLHNHTDLKEIHKQPELFDTKTLEEIPINEFISLVLKERNISFKDLTSKSLLDVKNDDGTVKSNKDSILVEETDEEGFTLTLEQFEILKRESLQLINSSINESSLLLEMISLLLSGVKPKQGALTMSPFLKQHLPMGSLNSDIIPMKQLLNNDVVKGYLVKLAWKKQSLKEINSYYENNFQRLQKQILIENQYWSIISDTKLNEKNCFVKNYKTNSISLKYGINGNQIANLEIVNENLDLFEIQLIPAINSHKLQINKSRKENVIFNYVQIDVIDTEKDICQSSSYLSKEIIDILKNSLVKNNLADQLNRLNKLQLQELLFNTLKNECKQNSNYHKDMFLENENLIKINALGKYQFVIKYESLSLEDLDEYDCGLFDKKINFANNIMDLLMSNLFYLNHFRIYNNAISRPIYYSKKNNSHKNQSHNYHNILMNLLVKINHKYLIKTFVAAFEANPVLNIKNVSDESNHSTAEMAILSTDNSQLKNLKTILNSFSPLISKPVTQITVEKENKEYTFEFSLTTTNSYKLVLMNDSKKLFNNITELLDYLTYISI